jgi:hypothetical protein
MSIIESVLVVDMVNLSQIEHIESKDYTRKRNLVSALTSSKPCSSVKTFLFTVSLGTKF